MRAVLREPLLHFLVLGALVFALFAVVDDGPPPVAGTALVVTEAEAERLAQQFEATWGRRPRAEELDSLIDAYIREEVYVREARALGLDLGDAVVRRRLQQKMEFLTESGGDAAEPTDAELAAHLQRYPERFARQAVVGFEQVPLGGGAGEIDAALAALRGGAEAGALGAPSLLPATIRPSPRVVVDGTFGDGFFDRVAALEPGRWVGPVVSAHGPHLVRVTAFEPARRPPLGEIRDEVERDWRGMMAERLRRERYEALSSRYEISRPDAAEVLGR